MLKFELLSSSMTCEQKFQHVDTLRILGMLNYMVGFLGKLACLKYMNLKCESYDKTVLDFLNALHVDQVKSHKGNELLITFWCSTMILN